MAGEMSEYERRRAANIARNAEMLAKLGVSDSVRSLKLAKAPPRTKSAAKRQREEPVVLRRSLRTRGVAPDTDFDQLLNHQQEQDSQAKKKAQDISWDEQECVQFSKLLTDQDQEAEEDSFYPRLLNSVLPTGDLNSSFDPSNFKLDGRDVVKLVPERIFSLTFLPLAGKPVLIAGDKSGVVGVWDAEAEEDVLRVYRPHKSPVSGISAITYDSAKLVTCSYDGCLLLMDIERAVFSRIHYADEQLTALCQPGSDFLYAAQGDGELKSVDARSKKVTDLGKLHTRRINTVDFNSQRPHLFVTASTDATVSVWDVRKIDSQSSLATMQHAKAVSSAYFSPLGTQVASTSYDNHIGLWRMQPGQDAMSEPLMIYHNNETNRWISTFRTIWSLSGQHLYVAGMSRTIDVISATGAGAKAASLRSEAMTSIPCRLAQHPLVPGLLAGGAGGGKVFLWRA